MLIIKEMKLNKTQMNIDFNQFLIIIIVIKLDNINRIIMEKKVKYTQENYKAHIFYKMSCQE